MHTAATINSSSSKKRSGAWRMAASRISIVLLLLAVNTRGSIASSSIARHWSSSNCASGSTLLATIDVSDGVCASLDNGESIRVVCDSSNQWFTLSLFSSSAQCTSGGGISAQTQLTQADGHSCAINPSLNSSTSLTTTTSGWTVECAVNEKMSIGLSTILLFALAIVILGSVGACCAYRCTHKKSAIAANTGKVADIQPELEGIVPVAAANSLQSGDDKKPSAADSLLALQYHHQLQLHSPIASVTLQPSSLAVSVASSPRQSPGPSPLIRARNMLLQPKQINMRAMELETMALALHRDQEQEIESQEDDQVTAISIDPA